MNKIIIFSIGLFGTALYGVRPSQSDIIEIFNGETDEEEDEYSSAPEDRVGDDPQLPVVQLPAVVREEANMHLQQRIQIVEQELATLKKTQFIISELGVLSDQTTWNDDKALSPNMIAYLNNNNLLKQIAQNEVELDVKKTKQVLCNLFHLPIQSSVFLYIILGLAVKTGFITVAEAQVMVHNQTWKEWLLQRIIEASAGTATMLIDRPADFVTCFIENMKGFSEGAYKVPLKTRLEQVFNGIRTALDDSRFYARNKNRWYKKSYLRALRFIAGGAVIHWITEGIYKKDTQIHLPESFKYTEE